MIDIAQSAAMIECPAIPTVATLGEGRDHEPSEWLLHRSQAACSTRARDAGLTQDTLAARVALSRTSVTNIEDGRQKMMLQTL
jgi:hypothetical protein